MITTPNSYDHTARDASKHGRVAGGPRRRGNIMLFVMFILGTLFAASMGFLALMRSDRQSITAQAEQTELNAVIDSVIDDVLVGRRMALLGVDGIPYNQDVSAWVEDQSGNKAYPRNPDVLDHWAEIPGVHPWLASIEPYSNGFNNTERQFSLEYFATTDTYRALDHEADLTFDETNSLYLNRVPLGRPTRIRPFGDFGSVATYGFDRADGRTLFDGSITDGDGDGVVDSLAFALSVQGDGGQRDWFRAPDLGPDGVSVNCAPDNFVGAPSFTILDPDLRTRLPCNDPQAGSSYPHAMRQALSPRLRDPDHQADDEDDLYLSLRLIQNGGMVNINSSHWSLVDNLLGYKGNVNALVAEDIKNAPYDVSTEQWLRRRFVLPPHVVERDGLGEAGLAAEVRRLKAELSPIPADLYTMLLGPMREPSTSPLRAFTLTDQPGDDGLVDRGFARRWLNPFAWNDPADTEATGIDPSYDVRHVLTTDSTDDLLMRPLPDHPDALNDMFDSELDPFNTARWPIYEASGQDSERAQTGTIAMPSIVSDGWVDAGGRSYFNSDDLNVVEMYPAHDPNAYCDNAVTNCNVLANWVGDPSFRDRVFSPSNLQNFANPRPKVPLALQIDSPGGFIAQNRAAYRPPRDDRGEVDHRLGRMQFALHSIGDINNPTKREIQTLQAYFAMMLSNLDTANISTVLPDGAGAGLWSLNSEPDRRNRIHNQAAALTANFIDYADADRVPTAVVSMNLESDPVGNPDFSNNQVYFGVEAEPFLSEFWVNETDGEYGVELHYPHPPGHNDFSLINNYGLRWWDGANNAVISITGDEGAGEDEGVCVFEGITTTIGPNTRYLVSNQTDNKLSCQDSDFWPQYVDTFALQLVRKVNNVWVAIDEMRPLRPAGGDPNITQDNILCMRDNFSQGGWRVPLPIFPVPGLTNEFVPAGNLTEGGYNSPTGSAADPFILAGFPPVHPTTVDLGLEGSFPNVGSLFLLMRYAHRYQTNGGTPMTRPLGIAPGRIDNGHMPVFEVATDANDKFNDSTRGAQSALYPVTLAARPLLGLDGLTIPWGQLVYDYFTALPFENDFDPQSSFRLGTSPLQPNNLPEANQTDGADGTEDGGVQDNVIDDAGFAGYLRNSQPRVRNGGLIVEGRININAAPWKVLEGVPTFAPWALPMYWNFSGPNPQQSGLFASTSDVNTSLSVPLATDTTWQNLVALGFGANPFLPMLNDPFLDSLTPWSLSAVPGRLSQLGRNRAQAIVAYREQRQQVLEQNDNRFPRAGNFNVLAGGGRARWNPFDLVNGSRDWQNRNQRHMSGFLTVGELANVIYVFPTPDPNAGGTLIPGAGAEHMMDNGQSFSPAPNYLVAIAPLVALNDSWLTVKGHNFTLYGTLRGAGKVVNNDGTIGEANLNAVRFEVGIDRSNLLGDRVDPNLRPEVTYSTRGGYLDPTN